MEVKPTHIVCVRQRLLGRDWRDRRETREGPVLFRAVDDELPFKVGRDAFYGGDPHDRARAFSFSDPRETLRQLEVARIVSVDWQRRRVTLQESALRLTIDFDEVSAVGGEL